MIVVPEFLFKFQPDLTNVSAAEAAKTKTVMETVDLSLAEASEVCVEIHFVRSVSFEAPLHKSRKKYKSTIHSF